MKISLYGTTASNPPGVREAAAFSPRAILAGIGVKIRELNVFEPIASQVKIAQKTVKYTPIQKLWDGFINLLCGAHGMVEVEQRLRNDPGLQQAFGQQGCAEQSVIQQTLDACDANNVEQMHQAMDAIYRQHSQGYGHDYTAQLQLLDMDMSGQPCGPKAAFASKGYFAGERNRRGRQLGRVTASRYGEIVVDRLFDGKTQLFGALQPLMIAAETTLQLQNDAVKRSQTVVRIDRGGGSLDDVNWLLQRGYRVHTKDCSAARSKQLAESVTQWVDDPQHPGRQVGWIQQPPTEYVSFVRRIAVRCRKNNGQWGIGVLISALSEQQVWQLSPSRLNPSDPHALLFAYVYFYDQRGGGVETSLKQDKQGLGITKRNKKRFEAQQMLVQLGVLAHNVTLWAKQWLLPLAPKLRPLGVLRLLRDVFTTSGQLVFDPLGELVEIRLNPVDSWAKLLAESLAALLKPDHVAVNLDKT